MSKDITRKVVHKVDYDNKVTLKLDGSSIWSKIVTVEHKGHKPLDDYSKIIGFTKGMQFTVGEINIIETTYENDEKVYTVWVTNDDYEGYAYDDEAVEKGITKLLNKQLPNVKVKFSEQGMQGENKWNFDIQGIKNQDFYL